MTPKEALALVILLNLCHIGYQFLQLTKYRKTFNYLMAVGIAVTTVLGAWYMQYA